MTGTMRAAVLEAPGPPEALEVRELPIPEPEAGWVLIRVRAFGDGQSPMLGGLISSGECVTRRSSPSTTA